MASELRTYRVFVSSPNDLLGERETIDQTISGLAPTYERRGARIIAWRWEKDALSDFGRPAQQVILSQLGEYDIYIGMMGSRFGTPTQTHGSGTEEEFEQALEAHRLKRVLRMGFFFKDVEVSTSSLDLDSIDQIRRVIEFRSKVGAAGLFQLFKTDVDLISLTQRLVTDAIDSDLEITSEYQTHFLGPAQKPRPKVSSVPILKFVTYVTPFSSGHYALFSVAC